MSFTRGSSATRTDSAGNIVEAVPYNLLQYSEQFDNAAWVKTNVSVTANSITSPSGVLNADFVVPNITNSIHRLTNSTASGLCTYSVFAKKGFYKNILVWFDIHSGGIGVNLETLAIFRNENITSYTIDNFGNDWFRISITANIAATATAAIYVYSNDATPRISWVANGSEGLYVWGAQLVEGTQPLPYQETVTRLALPRLDYRNADGTLSSTPRLLLEPQRTNSIRNSTMVGAVAGTPGTVPTNWFPSAGGLDRTIVGLGIENGLQYIDFRFYGVAITVDLMIPFDTTTGIPASNGQTWTNSFYFKSIDSTIAPVNYNLYVLQRTSGGSPTGGFMQSFVPTSTLSRYSQTVTTNSGFTAGIQPYFYALLAVGASYDFTIRIAAPQMELGAYPTTFIPTTTAAVTRLADACSVTGVADLIGQTEGTVFVEFSTANLENYTRRLFSLSDGTNSNQINLQIQTSTTTLTFAVLNGAAAQAVINTSTNFYTLGSTIKIAVAYKANDFAFYANGTQIGVDTLGTVPTCSQFRFADPLNSSNFVGGISQYALYTTRLSNAELQAITSL
jgi:hypothetical protein